MTFKLFDWIVHDAKFGMIKRLNVFMRQMKNIYQHLQRGAKRLLKDANSPSLRVIIGIPSKVLACSV